MGKEPQGKIKRKPRKPSERWKKYKISGEHVERTAKFCPRCGAGVFLSKHKNRLFCGRCHYTEFETRDVHEAKPEVKEEKKEEKKPKEHKEKK